MTQDSPAAAEVHSCLLESQDLTSVQSPVECALHQDKTQSSNSPVFVGMVLEWCGIIQTNVLHLTMGYSMYKV